jgi:hypothetical protein
MPTPRRSSHWNWKVADRDANARLAMLYEPGNWGDVLKGIWAVTVARQLIEAGRRKDLRYLDPFAGAPTYPLTEGARGRLKQLAGTELAALQAPFATRGILASTGRLVLAAAEAAGAAAELEVFDLDPERREAWAQLPSATVLPARSGLAALHGVPQRKPPPALVLVDPYDFLAEWKDLLPAAAAAAQVATVLVYVYNRAPRSAGHWNEYRRFRDRLTAARRGAGFLLGRAPSDARLPRAYHEVLLLGRAEFLARARGELEAATRALARMLAEEGAFEAAGDGYPQHRGTENAENGSVES